MRLLTPQLSHREPNMTPTGAPEPQKTTKTNGFLMFFIFLLFRSSWFFGHPLDLILVHFGRLWGPIGPSWVLPGVPQGALGVPLGSPWAQLGSSWVHLDPSWTHPGLLLAPLGSILLLYGCPGAHLAPIGVPLGSSWATLAPS